MGTGEPQDSEPVKNTTLFDAMNDAPHPIVEIYLSKEFTPESLPKFGFGQLVKTNLSGLTREPEDICLVTGISYSYRFTTWFYELKVIGSLSSYFQERTVFSIGSWVNRDESSLFPLTALDHKRYQKSLERKFNLINGGKK